MSCFSTHEAYVRSGSPNLERGDVVCILGGCKLLLVMRRDDGGSSIDKIIEDIYIDCVMNERFLKRQFGHNVANITIS
jgi:hypothetical protein